jgi:hypothetical protein
MNRVALFDGTNVTIRNFAGAQAEPSGTDFIVHEEYHWLVSQLLFSKDVREGLSQAGIGEELRHVQGRFPARLWRRLARCR